MLETLESYVQMNDTATPSHTSYTYKYKQNKGVSEMFEIMRETGGLKLQDLKAE